MSEIERYFSAFVETVKKLRDPVRGCPWDLEQTHETLRRYMIEEAYEASDAMHEGDPHEICQELGDVLLQVVLNAQIASEAKNGFGIVDVIRGIDAKMRRRHPHVFGEVDQTLSAEQVTEQWQVIKNAEKKTDASHVAYFAKEEKISGALRQAFEIGKRAESIGFDWRQPGEVFKVLRDEIDELESAFRSGDSSKIRDEMGDVFFSAVQLARHLRCEAESEARAGNLKFLRRMRVMEQLADAEGRRINELSQSELEEKWIEAKKR